MEQIKDKFNYIIKTIIGVALSIISFFLVNSYNNINTKMVEIQKELVTIQLKLTELHSNMLTRETVKEMIITEILKYHNNNNK